MAPRNVNCERPLYDAHCGREARKRLLHSTIYGKLGTRPLYHALLIILYRVKGPLTGIMFVAKRHIYIFMYIYRCVSTRAPWWALPMN